MDNNHSTTELDSAIADCEAEIKKYEKIQSDVQAVLSDDNNGADRKRIAIAHMAHVNGMLADMNVTLQNLRVAKYGRVAKWVKPA